MMYVSIHNLKFIMERFTTNLFSFKHGYIWVFEVNLESLNAILLLLYKSHFIPMLSASSSDHHKVIYSHDNLLTDVLKPCSYLRAFLNTSETGLFNNCNK